MLHSWLKTLTKLLWKPPSVYVEIARFPYYGGSVAPGWGFVLHAIAETATGEVLPIYELRCPSGKRAWQRYPRVAGYRPANVCEN